jgi:hypothetical protein
VFLCVFVCFSMPVLQQVCWVFCAAYSSPYEISAWRPSPACDTGAETALAAAAAAAHAFLKAAAAAAALCRAASQLHYAAPSYTATRWKWQETVFLVDGHHAATAMRLSISLDRGSCGLNFIAVGWRIRVVVIHLVVLGMHHLQHCSSCM